MKSILRAMGLLLLCLVIPVLAQAASGAQEAQLSPEDQNDINRIQTYLNQLHSFSADFMQVDDAGGVMRGTIQVQRPGKMHVTYSYPSKDFIIADGGMVHIWNDDLKSQTNVEENSSLANFILRDPIKLSGDVVVTKFQHFPAKLEVTLVQANDPAAGQLTLIFEDHPLLLRQWRVLDPQGRKTGVNLENEQIGVDFPSNTFNFTPPSFGKGGKAPDASSGNPFFSTGKAVKAPSQN